jgi:hypothetical protein
VEELNGIALCLCLLIHHLLLASPSPHFTRPIINQHLEQMKMLCHSWLIIFLLCNATINTRDCNGLSLDAAHRAKIASSMAKSELRGNERSVHAREQCSKCSRPLVQCLCGYAANTNVRRSVSGSRVFIERRVLKSLSRCL